LLCKFEEHPVERQFRPNPDHDRNRNDRQQPEPKKAHPQKQSESPKQPVQPPKLDQRQERPSEPKERVTRSLTPQEQAERQRLANARQREAERRAKQAQKQPPIQPTPQLLELSQPTSLPPQTLRQDPNPEPSVQSSTSLPQEVPQVRQVPQPPLPHQQPPRSQSTNAPTDPVQQIHEQIGRLKQQKHDYDSLFYSGQISHAQRTDLIKALRREYKPLLGELEKSAPLPSKLIAAPGTDSTPTGQSSSPSTGVLHDPNQTLIASGTSDTPMKVLPHLQAMASDSKVGQRNPVFLAQVNSEVGGGNAVDGFVRLLQFLGQGVVDVTGMSLGALGRWVSPPLSAGQQQQEALRRASQPTKLQSQNLTPPPRTASPPQKIILPAKPNPEPEKTPSGGPEKPDSGQSTAVIAASQARRIELEKKTANLEAQRVLSQKRTALIRQQTQRSQEQHTREQKGRSEIASELLSRYPASTRQQIINSAIADYRKTHPNETINPKNPQPNDAGTWQTVVSITASYYPQPSMIDPPTHPKVAPLSEPAKAPFAVPSPTPSPQPNQGPNLTKNPNRLERLDPKTPNPQQPTKVTAQAQQPPGAKLPSGSDEQGRNKPGGGGTRGQREEKRRLAEQGIEIPKKAIASAMSAR
jgi:hypothetical protein